MFIASHLWHPIMKRHLNISMKSIQVLKILCWTNFMASTKPISILYSLFYDSSLTKFFNEVPDVSDPTYLNGCEDSSSSLIMSKSVGKTKSWILKRSWRQIVRLQYWWQVQIHFKIILIFNFIDNKKNCEVSRTPDSFVLNRSENLTSSLMNKKAVPQSCEPICFKNHFASSTTTSKRDKATSPLAEM